VVDTACARTTPEGVFCLDHVPKPGQKAEKKEGGGSTSLKQLFMTLLFLTAGLALLIFVGEYLLSSTVGGMADTTGISNALKNTGWTIVYGMGGLTALIGLIWIATRARAK
jgi:hypothetical protein